MALDKCPNVKPDPIDSLDGFMGDDEESGEEKDQERDGGCEGEGPHEETGEEGGDAAQFCSMDSLGQAPS